MLFPMQESSAAPASSSPSSFASMLASLASSAQKPLPAWNDDALAEDVATLSYEQALRTHSRNRDPGAAELPAPHPMANGGFQTTAPVIQRGAVDGQASAEKSTADPQLRRKASSVTIRLTQAEAAQLHDRANEAGLTISAYLRSCIFEAETLRAEVRAALARIRSASPNSTKREGAGEAPGAARKTSPWRRFWSLGRRTDSTSRSDEAGGKFRGR
jgi:hypothetical protein